MGRQAELTPPKRGEVVVVDLRPALVIQNDIDNRHSPITIVAALTSRVAGERYPTEVVLHPPEGGLTRPSAVLLNQIRSVDKKRVVGRLGRLKPEAMERVDRALRISLGLVKL